MKQFKKDTKTFAVFNALYNGRALTADQARTEMGVGNLSAEATRIRQNGYAVYCKTRTDKTSGTKTTEFTMGTPSRNIVALGYAARAAGFTLDTFVKI